MDHSRLGLEGGDYFLGAPRFPPGTLRPRSPMVPIPGHDWDHDRGYSASGSMSNALGFRERDRERDLEECIRKYAITLRYITQLQAGLQTCRDNRVAALLNGAILAPGRYAIVNWIESCKRIASLLTSAPSTSTDIRHEIPPAVLGVSGLILIFVEVPLLLRICPTSEKFDVFIRRFTTNYMRAGMYTLMSLIQWLSLIRKTTSLVAAAVLLLAAAICYLIAGLKGQGFVGSKTLGGQGVAQMIV
ncbi:MAG: hypothetical protein L6R35_002415 [Caloplaca aegaea]|nr:MAG: hypothetical protein L6R35_002415 [Caloplaca aegaea]